MQYSNWTMASSPVLTTWVAELSSLSDWVDFPSRIWSFLSNILHIYRKGIFAVHWTKMRYLLNNHTAQATSHLCYHDITGTMRAEFESDAMQRFSAVVDCRASSLLFTGLHVCIQMYWSATGSCCLAFYLLMVSYPAETLRSSLDSIAANASSFLG